MIESLASVIGGPFAGFILGIISLKQALFLSGLLFLFLPIIYLIIKNREQAAVAAFTRYNGCDYISKSLKNY